MTARNTSISLGERFQSFVDGQVGNGRYASASEVVRAGLRLLETEETKLQMLRQALIEGERSGPPEAFDFDEFIVSKRTQTRAPA